MTHPHVVSVNVGRPVDHAWAGNLRRTAIAKRPVADPVRVSRRGLEDDEVADTVFHGGEEHKAVYAFALEDLAYWAERLGGPVPPAMFGENLTTAGIDVNEALVGERWRIGSVLLEVAEVRIPCVVFKNWLGLHDLDSTGWVRRFAAVGRPGPYLRVLEEGSLRAGDPIDVVERPGHGFTVSMMFRALTTEAALIPALLAVPGLSEEVCVRARRRLDGLDRTGESVPSRGRAGYPTAK